MTLVFRHPSPMIHPHQLAMRAMGSAPDVDQGLLGALRAGPRVLLAVDDARTTAGNLASALSYPGTLGKATVPFVFGWEEMVALREARASDPISVLADKARISPADVEAFEREVREGTIQVALVAHAREEAPKGEPWSTDGLLGRLEVDLPGAWLVVLLEDALAAGRWEQELPQRFPSWPPFPDLSPASSAAARLAPERWPWPLEAARRIRRAVANPAGPDELSRLVNASRPILLAGPPGVGKSSMATMAIREWTAITRGKAIRLSLAGLAGVLGAGQAIRALSPKNLRAHRWIVLEDADRMCPASGTLPGEREEILGAIGFLARQAQASRGRFRLVVTTRHDEMRGAASLHLALARPPFEVVSCDPPRTGRNARSLAINHGLRRENPDDLAYRRVRLALVSLASRILSGTSPSSPEELDPCLRDSAWLTLVDGAKGGQEVRFRDRRMCEELAREALLEPGAFPLSDGDLDALGWRPVMLRLAQGPHSDDWPDSLLRAVQDHERRHWSGFRDYGDLEEMLGDPDRAAWTRAFGGYYLHADYAPVVRILLQLAAPYLLVDDELQELMGPAYPGCLLGGPVAILVSCLQDLFLDEEALWVAGTIRRRLQDIDPRGRDWHEVGGSLARLRMRKGTLAKALPLLEQKAAFHLARGTVPDEVARDANDMLLWHALSARNHSSAREILEGLLERHDAANRLHDELEDSTEEDFGRSRVYADRNLSHSLPALPLAKAPKAAVIIEERVDRGIAKATRKISKDPAGRDPGPLGYMLLHRALRRFSLGREDEAREDARLAVERLISGHYRYEAFLASRLLPGNPDHQHWIALGDEALARFLKHRDEVEDTCLILRPALAVATPVMRIPTDPPGAAAWRERLARRPVL